MSKSFCATGWNPDVHLRVYSNRGFGMSERCYDGDSWFTGGFSSNARTVSATARTDENCEHINVYTVDSNNNITEQCWDGIGRNWHPGTFQATGVDVSAVSWFLKGNHVIHIYVVNPDHTITEYAGGGGAGDTWYQSPFPGADAAGVETTTWREEFEEDPKRVEMRLRVYVRGLNGTITEHYRDESGAWAPGHFKAEGVKDMSVASYVKGANGRSLRAFTVSDDGHLTEHCWDGDEWFPGSLSLDHIDSASATAWTSMAVEVFGFPTGPEKTHLRLYTKNTDSRMAELYWDGSWHDGDFTTGSWF